MIASVLFAVLAPIGVVAFVAKPAGVRPTTADFLLAVFTGITWYGGVEITFLSRRAGFVAGLLATFLVATAIWWPAAPARSTGRRPDR